MSITPNGGEMRSNSVDQGEDLGDDLAAADDRFAGRAECGWSFDTDHETKARAIVLRLLTHSAKPRAQLHEALVRKDIPEDAAVRVLDRFADVGLVDDAAYAQSLVRTRHSERNLSRRAIAQELRRRGVGEAEATEALAQLQEEDEEDAARAVVRRKLRETRGLDRQVRMRRAGATLGRKGYSAEVVSRVIREELAAEDAADTGDSSGIDGTWV